MDQKRDRRPLSVSGDDVRQRRAEAAGHQGGDRAEGEGREVDRHVPQVQVSPGRGHGDTDDVGEHRSDGREDGQGRDPERQTVRQSSPVS